MEVIIGTMQDKSKKITNITWSKEKFFIFLIIVVLSFLVLYLNNVKSFLSIIAVVAIGVLLPKLFDITDIILKKTLELNEITNAKRYEKTFKIYNERLLNFAVNFYFFIAEILVDEQKEHLNLPPNSDFSLKTVAMAFSNLLKYGQPTFKRIEKDGKKTFSDDSWKRFCSAQGELCDIYRILKSLPNILEFTCKRYPEFINLQSAFYQIKDNFKYNASSRACEAFTEAFLKDLIEFLSIQ